MRADIPDLPDVVVPFGKGIVRRPGEDVTLVAWGRAVWTALKAAEDLAKEGISLEVVDLRTIVPPDLDLVRSSVARTRRLLVACDNRVFGGFQREIQGTIAQENPGMPTRALGQKYVPGVAQSLVLEDAVVLTAEDIVGAAREMCARAATPTAVAGWSFVPHRYFIS